MRAFTNDVQVTYSTGGSVDFYAVAPCYGTLKDVRGVVQGNPGDDETVTVIDASANTLGVLTFGESISAGDTGTWVGDATTGNTHVDRGDAIKLTLSQGAGNAAAWIQLEWEPDGLDHV